MNLNELFEDLAANPSRNYKIETLKKHDHNVLLRKVIFLALDPFTQFYQRKIPKYTTDEPVWHSLESALPKLDKLIKREVTGNAAIQYLSLLLSEVSPDDAKVIERIIQKDLKCGVSAATVNAVWPNLVHEYPCMLCSAYDQKLVSKIKFPAYVQLKMDGMRFNAIVKDGKCEFRSRNGKEIQLLGNLEQEFIALAAGKNLVFDGELLVNDKGIVLDRQTGNGILNKANKGTIATDEARKVHATVWDVIPYEDFVAGKSIQPYHTRFSILESMSLPKKINLVERTIVGSLEEAQTIFEKYLADGQEGIILKDMSGFWEDKRAKHQIKFKGELECDLEVIGYEEGTGKYAGMLGALVCRSRSTDAQPITVNVGSGFSDDDRVALWSVRDKLLGKIVALKYNARIKNKQGGDSLFLPIFLELREDKDIADQAKDIK